MLPALPATAHEPLWYARRCRDRVEHARVGGRVRTSLVEVVTPGAFLAPGRPDEILDERNLLFPRVILGRPNATRHLIRLRRRIRHAERTLQRRRIVRPREFESA